MYDKKYSKYSQIRYSDSRYEAANYINDNRFRNLQEIDSNFFEINMGRQNISLNLPNNIGHHILCLAKMTMLSFYYDFCCIFFRVDHMSLIEMDTDSLFFCHTYKSIDELVRDNMKDEYNRLVYGSCFKKLVNGKEVPDLDLEVKPAIDYLNVQDESLKGRIVYGNYYLPRKCCRDHEKLVDSRTTEQFKLEMKISAQDGVMYCLNSKTYVAHSDEMNFTKLSSKSI